MKVSQIILLQERLNGLSLDGKEYLSLALKDLPSYNNSFIESLIKMFAYIITMILIDVVFQDITDVKFFVTIICSFPFFMQAMSCIAVWDSWNVFYKESLKDTPNLQALLKYCVDTRANLFKTLLISILATFIFSGVMIFIENGILFSIPAAACLLAVGYFKGIQSLLKIRFLMFISNDISKFKEGL